MKAIAQRISGSAARRRRFFQLSAVAIALAAPFNSTPGLEAQEVQRFTINQVIQLPSRPPALHGYLEILDAARQPTQGLTPAQLSGTLGEHRLSVERLQPFESAGEGVAYIFLVDISQSLSVEQFNRIRAAIDSWIAGLNPNDRVAIVAFGDESRLVVDFTNQGEELHRGLQTLGPTDGQTTLYRALADGLTLGRRRDPELPTRRAIVVLTDGQDEGSGLVIDDVLAQLRDHPMPIHTIGYSRLREPKKQRYLDVLGRLAANSGGSFHNSENEVLSTVYKEIRHAVERVWVADLSCAECPTDGASYRLQLNLTLHGRTFSQGTDVRLLPLSDLRPVEATPAPEAPTERVAEVPAPPTEVHDDPEQSPESSAPTPLVSLEPETKIEDGTPWPWLWLLVIPLAALAYWFFRRASPTVQPSPASVTRTQPELPAPRVPAPDARPIKPRPRKVDPVPVSTRQVRLIVVRGSTPGQLYQFELGRSGVVGKSPQVACTLEKERLDDPELFELSQREGKVWFKNMGGTQPTLLNGQSVDGEFPLKKGDLVGTSEMILRIEFDD